MLQQSFIYVLFVITKSFRGHMASLLKEASAANETGEAPVEGETSPVGPGIAAATPDLKR
jgi:hypothetical protein